ncbi:RNA-directed DNA polymerase [Cupriavidus sp. CV2]|uniref:RNA-directed DNA polymerase n=1 Tax=Cupriavidus ulmosensis TaxID=3065913 RepID=UPI00296A9523|nr:RNA-directed DNA polymerase [Cupriavidus sp. CV2]MDW3683900.1 RNA-directed DNA polymerase [Cupriavidus sp. CV2]
MATRTTTTRTTSFAPAPSADQTDAGPAGFSFEDLVIAYFDCRKNKRNTHNALAFEQHLERNLCRLADELADGSYRPGRSICFVVTRPKAREVWAADFRDRVVHHLLYNHIAPRFYASFIADSCACIPGRGTLYAACRLEAKVRSITQNWVRPAWYLKCDLANFFVSIDKRVLRAQLAARITDPWWMQLTDLVLMHDPRPGVVMQSTPELLSLVPPHKSLLNQPTHRGLPIGNLSSQFFANVYLDALDQHAKHQVRARHYIRYVDDFLLLHESPQWLNAAHDDIEAFLPRELGARLNPAKTILQPVARGVDFVGQVIRPWVRTTRARTVNEGASRLRQMGAHDVHASANSYFGLLRQATGSHADRARLANIARRRGHAINFDLTKAYRRRADQIQSEAV